MMIKLWQMTLYHKTVWRSKGKLSRINGKDPHKPKPYTILVVSNNSTSLNITSTKNCQLCLKCLVITFFALSLVKDNKSAVSIPACHNLVYTTLFISGSNFNFTRYIGNLEFYTNNQELLLIPQHIHKLFSVQV